MYKLNGHSLARGEMIIPESQPMTLQERESSCSITLGPDAPEISFNDWILDDGWPEGDTVWRVKCIGDATQDETATIEMEHAIKTLSDLTLNGEVTTRMISGGSTCTARQAIEYILNQQSDWVLGDCDYNVSNPYEFDGDELFDAIGIVTASLEDSQWEYDMSVYPFILHIRRRNALVGCEMRGGRNLSTLRRSISRSGMYTRIYPAGKNNLQLTEGYLSKNENLYGRIDHRETDGSISTAENLRAWAQGRLNRHCEPVYTVTISGLELSQETGEELDRLKLNRVCRVPLPKRSLTITERIVKLQWRDRKKEPENVTVTLANNSEDVTTIIKRTGKSGGKAASGQAKQNYLFQANGENLLYEIFDECGHVHGQLRMTEESLRIGFENLNESTRSEFRMTSESLRIQFENEISSTRSAIEQEAGRITAEVTRATGAEETLAGRVTITERAITQEVTDRTSADSTLSGRITTEANKITQIVQAVGSDGSVTAASIVLAINNSTGQSEAKIDAGHVYIGNTKSTTVIAGKVNVSDLTADYLSSRIAEITLMSVNSISVAGGTSLRGTLIVNDRASFPGGIAFGYGVGDTVLHDCVADAEVSGSTLTLTKASGTQVTFNRAVSLSGVWNGTTYGVSATSGVISGTAPSTTVYQAIEGAANPNATVYAKIYKDNPNVAGNQISSVAMTLGESTSGKYVELYTGSGSSKIQKGKISTAATYNAGWDYGLTQRVRSTRTATSQETTIKTLDYSERFAIVDTYTSSNGGTSSVVYVVAAKADRYGDGQTAAGVTYNTSTHKVSRALSGSTKEVLIDMYTGNAWSNGERVIEARIGNDAINSTTITAPTVTISCDCTDLGSSEEGNDKAISITAKHGTASKGSGSQVIHMGTGSWSNGKIGVTCRLTDSNGKCLNRIYVSLPSTASWSYSYISSSVGYQINCTIGGKTYTTTHRF